MITLDHLCSDIQQEYDSCRSWRAVGRKYSLNPSMARLIARGYHPGPKISRLLNLPPRVDVIVVLGEVPPGAQTIAARLCSCGQWFIANHPRRSHCFICRPYKESKK